MTDRRRPYAGVLVAASVLFASLGGCGGVAMQKAAATAYADRYFAALAGGEVEDVLPLYAASFYAVTPRERWTATLRGVRARCGKPTTHSLAGWQVTSRVGTVSGSTATLQYTVAYASCRMMERITIATSDGGPPAIVGHELDPASGSPAARPSAPVVEST